MFLSYPIYEHILTRTRRVLGSHQSSRLFFLEAHYQTISNNLKFIFLYSSATLEIRKYFLLFNPIFSFFTTHPPERLPSDPYAGQ